MNRHLLMPVFYLPPISWFHFFLKKDSQVLLEAFENFPKQTYRNRAHIYGANGKLPLIIPIRHTGARVYQDIEISYAEDWQALHWKSIKTAYQSSAYFEFYEDRLQTLYEEKEPSLLKFNLRALKLILELLKEEKPLNLTVQYEKSIEGEDLRMEFSAKQPSFFCSKPYYQNFADKLGYLQDLSVLDLLCNLGPESSLYIKTCNE